MTEDVSGGSLCHVRLQLQTPAKQLFSLHPSPGDRGGRSQATVKPERPEKLPWKLIPGLAVSTSLGKLPAVVEACLCGLLETCKATRVPVP